MSSRIRDQITSFLGPYDEEQEQLIQQFPSSDSSELDILTRWKQHDSMPILLSKVIERFQDTFDQLVQLRLRAHWQAEEFVSHWITQDLLKFDSTHFQELGSWGEVAESKAPSIMADPLLLRAIQSIRNSDYETLLGLAAKLHDATDRQSALNVLERAFSFSIASSNDPLLSAKFEDLQLSLIQLRKALKRNPKGNGKIREMVSDLEDKLRSSRDVYRALEELGLSTTEIFGNFEVKNLPDGKVQYVWKNSGLDKESPRR